MSFKSNTLGQHLYNAEVARYANHCWVLWFQSIFAARSGDAFPVELTVKPLQIVSEQLNGLAESMIALLPNFIAAFVILLITGAFAFIVGRVFERLMRRSRARPSLVAAIVKLARIAIWLLGFLIAATIVAPNLTPTKLLAGLGLGSIAIGLAFKDIFENLGIDVPKTWADFKAAGATLNANNVTPITIGTKYLWTAGGVFDYMNLRTNGYDFHMALTKGEVSWTDDRVKATFANWKELVDEDFFLENHAALTWQEALAPMVQGDAAMYVMGNFAVAPLREAGLSDDQIGFFQFPQIDANIDMAEEAPTDTMHIPANAKNKADAKKFLAFLGRADVQTKMNAILGQLPINKNSTVSDDKFLQAGMSMLSSTTGGIAQFFDRDAPAEMAQAGMEGFQEFMVKPERLDAILKRLDKTRARAYK